MCILSSRSQEWTHSTFELFGNKEIYTQKMNFGTRKIIEGESDRERGDERERESKAAAGRR